MENEKGKRRKEKLQTMVVETRQAAYLPPRHNLPAQKNSVILKLFVILSKFS